MWERHETRDPAPAFTRFFSSCNELPHMRACIHAYGRVFLIVVCMQGCTPTRMHFVCHQCVWQNTTIHKAEERNPKQRTGATLHCTALYCTSMYCIVGSSIVVSCIVSCMSAYVLCMYGMLVCWLRAAYDSSAVLASDSSRVRSSPIPAMAPSTSASSGAP